MSSERTMSVSEAVDYLGVTRARVYKLYADKRILGYGGTIRLEVESVEKFKQERDKRKAASAAKATN